MRLKWGSNVPAVGAECPAYSQGKNGVEMTPQFNTAVVYVVSPDRGEQLLRSVHSLVRSGSRFDLVRVCCVGPQRGNWRFADPRIRIEPVAPLFGRYFYGNKLHLCDTPASRVIFLDADTLVQRSLGTLWQNRSVDFLARRGTAMAAANWNRAVWRNMFIGTGKEEVPMFNAGVLVFQGGSHHRIKHTWHSLMTRFLAGALPMPNPDKRMYEQWALAMAVAQDGISFAELGPEEHAFRWQNEHSERATIFHFGNRFFRSLPPVLPDGADEDSPRVNS
jgi:hypothetical protein